MHGGRSQWAEPDLCCHLHIGFSWRLAGAHVAAAVDHDQAVVAEPGPAEVAAPVRAARRHTPGTMAGAPERGGYSLAATEGDRRAVEVEGQRKLLLAGVCWLARLPPNAQCSRGTSINNTSTLCGVTPSSRTTASVMPRTTPAFCSGVRPGYMCIVTKGILSQPPFECAGVVRAT